MPSVEKISCVICSKDEPDALVGMIRQVYDLVDDIVVVDSSNEKNRKTLDRGIKGLKRVRVFNAVALGYLEPYRPYGFKKAKYDWILSLDTDEKLNDGLRDNLRKIVKENKGYYAIAIVRSNFLDGKRIYENYGIRLRPDGYHVRLYRKSKIHYEGVVHEAPMIEGEAFNLHREFRKVLRLPNKYQILQNHTSGTYDYKFMKCMKLEAFQRRQSYGTILLYLHGAVKSAWRAYMKTKGKGPEDELTRSDYIFIEKIFSMRYTGNRADLLKPLPLYFRREIETIFAMTPELKKLSFDISEDIRKAHGVINYLALKDGKSVEKLTKKYRSSKVKGIDLLLYIISKEFYRRHPDYGTLLTPEEVIALTNAAIEKDAPK